jgi:hypothetical protein
MDMPPGLLMHIITVVALLAETRKVDCLVSRCQDVDAVSRKVKASAFGGTNTVTARNEL